MSEQVEPNPFAIAMTEAQRIGREAEQIAAEEGFDPNIPLDPLSKEAVEQVMRLGLARSVDEARYLLSVNKTHWKVIRGHLDKIPISD